MKASETKAERQDSSSRRTKVETTRLTDGSVFEASSTISVSGDGVVTSDQRLGSNDVLQGLLNGLDEDLSVGGSDGSSLVLVSELVAVSLGLSGVDSRLGSGSPLPSRSVSGS